MHKDEELFREIGQALREGPSVSPTLDLRVMSAVRALPRHRHLGLWGRINRPRPMMVSPASWGLAAAAALMIAVLGGVGMSRAHSIVGWATAANAAKSYPVTFTFPAPEARKAAVVGPFNGWDPNDPASQAHHAGGGLWTVTVRVPVGYHQYSIVLDDNVWVPDPNAPRAPGTDVARVNSAINVGADGQ